jgi:hypothetical protein
LNKKDEATLKSIKAYFGVGKIFFSKKDNCYNYVVSSVKELTYTIIPHFIKYPLITKKQIDFFLFKSIVELINAKEHRSLNGLHKIVNIKASLNKGLSETLKKAFPNLKPVPREAEPSPPLLAVEIQDPN